MHTKFNRPLILLTCCMMAAAAVLSAQSPNGKSFLSFSAKVAEESAPLYSSPGEDQMYETGHLSAGALVEICYRTDDGWCAIRPPEGSFSWINGDYVLRGGGNKGTVCCPDQAKEVPVRVGADSILKSTDVQVGLTNGREVRILGEQTLTGNKTWLKIAPPRGEFRWIHEKSIEKDEFFSRIPNRLTRYEELLAQDSIPETSSEPNPEELSRLDEEQMPEQSDDGRSPIRNVSFRDGFNSELARLYSDLFTTLERPAQPESFDLLAERASVLASMAATDQQRGEIQKVSEKIAALRNAQPRQGEVQPGTTGLAESQPVYRSVPAPGFAAAQPNAGRTPEPEEVVFSVPGKPSETAAPSEAAPKNKIRFAFAPRSSTPISADSKTAVKKSAFAGKPSTIVPPANYTYPAPAMLKIGSEDKTSPETPENAGTTSSAPQKADQNAGKVFLAENEPANEIRQVTALFVKPDIDGTASVPAQEKPGETETSAASPAPAKLPVPALPFDASGTLGYLPKSSRNAPRYALVNQVGNQLTILCYVAPAPGKSLEPFVGQKIGVAGTRGWFKNGSENRKMIVAERIIPLK